ncbi:selenoprotein S-like [Bolinopsis microptera]|uniref:selenoprotein S-like n=1 Tax=Bolinopsis microptera TaxID=2820187 RepID=UPI00307AFBF5
MSESVLSDDDVIIDHDPQEHPPVLSNKNPYLLSTVVSYVWSVFETHGYVILIGAIVTYYVYQKLVEYLEQKVQSKRDGVQSNLSPEEQMNRLEAMRRAREKLQAEVDVAAAIEAEKIREREEQQRQDKIEDWERHKKGGGYRSKLSNEPAKKKSLKLDSSNPLMGHGTSGGKL